jgi:hypothetical protein
MPARADESTINQAAENYNMHEMSDPDKENGTIEPSGLVPDVA